MNHYSADCAMHPNQTEQQQRPVAAAGRVAPAGSSSSSGGSPSWPPPPGTASNDVSCSTSFFRQLFAEEDESAAAGGAVSSSYAVDDLLLPPASTAFNDDVNSTEDSVFELGVFPMVDSFMDAAAAVSARSCGPSLGRSSDDKTLIGKPHTLEFATPPNYSASRQQLVDTTTCADDDVSLKSPKLKPRTEETSAYKKAKLSAPEQHCSTSGANNSAAGDPTQFQSVVMSKVNQSQYSARSKEKLGERINALQQLVSPFGKTDTASVLSEAIGYIKFLQEQVQVLSSPYMKPTSTLSTNSLQDARVERGASDLRSRGLCLVPVSCTMTVANNNNFNIGADYWASTPNFSSTMGSTIGATSTRFSASS